MSVGSGLVLSALLLGLVILFVATKDRWRWGRIARWSIGVPAVLFIVAALGVWGYTAYTNRPSAPGAFFGLKAGASMDDVRFAKGEPSSIDWAGRWIYLVGLSSAGVNASAYAVRFVDKKIRYVMYVATPAEYVHPNLQGFQMGSPYDAVLEKLGQPSNLAVSKDGLERLLSFDKFGTFYDFEKGVVASYGIFDPATGPLDFNSPLEAASAPASASTKP